MAVETTTIKTTQTMTIALVEFAFTFRALTSAPSDIKCIRTTAGVDTDMTFADEIPSPSTDTDVLTYTVSVNASGIGGTVTVAWPSTSSTITIYRETSNIQSSVYEDYNQFPAETVGNDFDKRTMITQEIADLLSRTLFYPITNTTGSTLVITFAGTASQIRLESGTVVPVKGDFWFDGTNWKVCNTAGTASTITVT